MPLNLLTDPWLPVRRQSGVADLIAPPGITAVHDDPVVAVDWPRPDFRLATLEFLIGLLHTACPPHDHTAWRDGWRAPPGAAQLAAAFAPLSHAFDLDGDGPRFMQDAQDFATDPNDVAALLIESPGDKTIKRNTDLMVRRGRVGVMGRPAAAMALFTLQTYAPAGGAGHRTGLRGGGPLTTLVIPPRPADGLVTLWERLWANVPSGVAASPADLPRLFPWLARTRTSEAGRSPTTPADVDARQCWWGMPRRIRLDFRDEQVACDITGRTDDRVVRTWRQRPWGTNYETWGGVHPLSPCYRMKPGAKLLYLHPQPGGIGYQHWQSVLSRVPSETRSIAPTVATFAGRYVDVRKGRMPWRLLAAGFDMADNMKARGFTESEIPVSEPGDPAASLAQDQLVRGMVEAANIVASLLARCARRALFGDGATVATDTAALAALRERLWGETSAAFHAAAAAVAGGVEPDAVQAGWLATLSRTARALFAEAAPMDASGTGHPERIAAAARTMRFALTGYGVEGKRLFEVLERVLPEQKISKRKKAA